MSKSFIMPSKQDGRISIWIFIKKKIFCFLYRS
jgi:hypothetical protein